MNEPDSSKFKVRFDDDEPENVYREEIEEQKVDRISHRLTLISVLLPVLISVVLFVSYLHIKKWIDTTHTTGSAEVRSLSQELESRFSSLSLKIAKMEESLAQSLVTVEKKSAELAIEVKKTQQALDQFNTAKLDKKELEPIASELKQSVVPLVSELKQSVAPLTAELEQVKQIPGEVNALERRMQQDLADIASSLIKINDAIEKINVDMVGLTRAKLDQQQLDSTLQRRESLLLKKIAALRKEWQSEISALNRKLAQVERMTAVPRTPANLTPTIPSRILSPPSSGKINEQNLN